MWVALLQYTVPDVKNAGPMLWRIESVAERPSRAQNHHTALPKQSVATSDYKEAGQRPRTCLKASLAPIQATHSNEESHLARVYAKSSQANVRQI